MPQRNDALMRLSRLDEIAVRDPEGAMLGSVRDLLLEPRSGRLRYLLLAPAEQSDPGPDAPRLAWDRLRHDPESGAFQVADEREASGEPAGKSGLLHGRDLAGAALNSADGEAIGRLNDLVVDGERGEAVYALLEDEEGRRIPLPWALLAYDEASRGFRLAAERERLRGAPNAHSDARSDAGTSEPIDWSDRVWAERLHEHYGLQPYWTVRSQGTG